MNKKVVHLKNILDFPLMDIWYKLKAIFRAYEISEDCTIFTVIDQNETELGEICIYGYEQSFFDFNDVNEILTEKSECITISVYYPSEFNTTLYVYNPEYNKAQKIISDYNKIIKNQKNN